MFGTLKQRTFSSHDLHTMQWLATITGSYPPVKLTRIQFTVLHPTAVSHVESERERERDRPPAHVRRKTYEDKCCRRLRFSQLCSLAPCTPRLAGLRRLEWLNGLGCLAQLVICSLVIVANATIPSPSITRRLDSNQLAARFLIFSLAV